MDIAPSATLAVRMKLLKFIDEREMGIASALLGICLLLATVIGLDINRRHAFEDREYVIATDHSPPFQIVGSDGQVSGAMVEAIDRAAARLHIKLKWRAVPKGPDFYLGVDPGVDLWPLVMELPERKGKFHIAQSFARAGYILVSTHKIADPSAEAMSGKTIAFRDVPFFHRLFARNFPTSISTPIKEVDSVLLAACRGEVFAAVTEPNQMNDFLLRNRDGCAPERLHVIGIPNWNLDLSVGSTNQTAAVADAIRVELGALAREHALDDLFTRYQPLASLRDANTFVETDTERFAGVAYIALLALCLISALLGARVIHLRRKTRRALRLADDRYRYLADMSHELRTPLNGILGMASLLGDANLTVTQREYLKTIHSSGSELLGIINNVLDLAKLESHAGTVESEWVTPREVAQTLLQMFVPTLQSRNIEAVVYVEPDVPASVKIDAGKFRQIFVNLVGNATKFTAKGFVHVRLSFVVFPTADRHLRVEVLDSGPGIPEKEQARLFRSFQQTSSGLKSELKGSGLGLEISKRLAYFAGGRLGFESEVGKGSKFWYELPCEAGAPPAKQSADPSDEPNWESTLRGKRVLIVGGTELLTLSLKESLSSCGAVLRFIGSLDDLESTPEPGDVDLVLLDALAVVVRKEDAIAAVRRYWMDRSVDVAVLCNGERDADEVSSWRLSSIRSVLKPVRAADLARAKERSWEPATGLARLARAVSDPRPRIVPKGELHAASRSQQLRILVGEDNPVNRVVIRAVIERLGHFAQVVADGALLVRELEDGGDYDMILMDCNMPGLDGYEASMRIREIFPDKLRLPIVAVTANSPADVYERCVAAGMNDVVGKPISSELLRGIFTRYIRTERTA